MAKSLYTYKHILFEDKYFLYVPRNILNFYWKMYRIEPLKNEGESINICTILINVYCIVTNYAYNENKL